MGNENTAGLPDWLVNSAQQGNSEESKDKAMTPKKEPSKQKRKPPIPKKESEEEIIDKKSVPVPNNTDDLPDWLK